MGKKIPDFPEEPFACDVCGTHYEYPYQAMQCQLGHLKDVDISDAPQIELHAQPDMVNHPPHYTSHPSGVECIQVVEHMSFCIGNAIKYLWRCDMKNGLEDLQKARWYIDREIERRKGA